MVVSKLLIHKEGFTFIEIIVCLAIVSSLIVVVISSLNYHVDLLDRQRTMTIAYLLAKEKIRELKKDLKVQKGNFPEPNQSFVFEAQIKESDYPSMLEITVKVSKDKETALLSELIEKKQ